MSGNGSAKQCPHQECRQRSECSQVVEEVGLYQLFSISRCDRGRFYLRQRSSGDGYGIRQTVLIDNGIVGGVTATLPFFTGGQIINANKLADVNVDVSLLQRRQSENEVKLTVEQYFWQVVTLKEKLRTIGTLQTQLEQIHQDVKAAVAAGVTNRNDLLQVELRKNEMRSKHISLANTLEVSLQLLAQYIGCPMDSTKRMDVYWEMDGELPVRPDEFYRSPESSLPLTVEYHLLNKQVDASRLQYKMTLGKNLPTVALGGGYVYENLMDRSHSFWIGGVTVSVPLTKWWGGSYDMKRQKLQVHNSENQLTDQSELLIIRMRNSWNAMNDAYQQVQIAIESIGQAKENLRLQSDYYQAGTCTMRIYWKRRHFANRAATTMWKAIPNTK